MCKLPIAAIIALNLSCTAGLCSGSTEVALQRCNKDVLAVDLETVQLQELWRAGDEDGEVFFGLVAQVLRHGNGLVYVLDAVLSRLVVFDIDGVLVDIYELSGEGPGQVRFPVDLVELSDGNLGVLQMFPCKIEVLDPSGKYVRTFRPRGGPEHELRVFEAFDCSPVGSGVAIVGEVNLDDEEMHRVRTNFVRIYDETGVLRNDLWKQEKTYDVADFNFKEDLWFIPTFRQLAVDEVGAVYMPTCRNRLAICKYDTNGIQLLQFGRKYEARRRTQGEYAVARGVAEGETRQLEKARLEISSTVPAIEALEFVRPRELWVTTSHTYYSGDPGVVAVYDVFGLDGKYVKKVKVMYDETDASNRLFWVDASHSVLVTGLVDAITDLKLQRHHVNMPEAVLYEKAMEVVFLEVQQ